MKLNVLTIALGVSLAAGAALAQATSPQSAASRIERESGNIRQALQAKPDSDPNWKAFRPVLARSLDDAQAALKAGDIYLALEDLGKAYAPFHSAQYLDENDAAIKDLPGFEAQWQRVSVEMSAFDSAARNRAWGELPVVIRALSESSAGKTGALLSASRAYAKVTSSDSGLYYLGATKAAAAFADFAASLDLHRHGAPFPLRSYSPELKALQTRLNAAFQPPLSIDKHPQFIRLNATVKLANELDAAGLYAGALYSYLSAVEQLGALQVPEVDATQQARITSAISGFQEQLAASGHDESIAELFLQQARALSAPQAEKDPADWKSAGAIVSDVLPAYFAAAKAAPVETPSGKRSTTITLVRWPYT